MGRRKKAVAATVPANRSEAEGMLADFVRLERDALEERLKAERQIDQVKADRDAMLADIEAERGSIFAGLKAWWEAGGAKLVAGRNRSAELANATIGIRKPPPSLKLPRGLKAADLVAWISGLRLAGKGKYLRTPKTQLDKNAVIKDLREGGSLAKQLGAKGVTIEQVDEFFIDAGLDEEAIKKEISAS